MIRRWMIAVPTAVTVAAIGLRTWQVLATRSQLHAPQRQVASLRASAASYSAEARRTMSAENQMVEAADSALKRAATVVTDTTTTQPRVAPSAFVDQATLTEDLDSAFSTTTGFLPSAMNPAYLQASLAKFLDEEQQQTALAEAGKPYYVPDPVAEANAYVAANP